MTTDTLSATEHRDLLDKVGTLSIKLHAMLCMTYADQGESFRGLNDEIQDNYMWACSDIATELKDAASQL